MYLPGTINERIGDLRRNMKLSQKELSKITGIASSQISRIESGAIQNVSSDILIKLADVFGVSADYILGLTEISSPKNYDIGELGLSEKAAKDLAAGKIDAQMLNRLMEHKSFAYLLYMIRAYFDDSVSKGIVERNAVIDMATAAIGDFVKGNPGQKAEAQGDMRFLKSAKLGDHDAETEKIKNTFMAILRDIKKDMDSGKTTGRTATAEFMEAMRGQMQAARSEDETIGIDDVISAMTDMVGQSVQLDDASAELFRQLAKNVLTNTGEQPAGSRKLN